MTTELTTANKNTHKTQKLTLKQTACALQTAPFYTFHCSTHMYHRSVLVLI